MSRDAVDAYVARVVAELRRVPLTEPQADVVVTLLGPTVACRRRRTAA